MRLTRRMEKERSEVRELVLSSRVEGSKRFPRGVRERVLAYASARFRAGLSGRAVADEIGLNLHTLRFWCDRASDKPSRKLKTVVVRVQPATDPLTLYGPRGIRIEGLTIESAAGLLRELE